MSFELDVYITHELTLLITLASSACLISLILLDKNEEHKQEWAHDNLWGNYYNYAHFSDEETEAYWD